MENKEELEKFNSLGADEKDQKEKLTKEELLKTFDLNGDGVISQEEIDIVKENIEKIVKDPNNSFGKSFIDAYNRLSKEDQDNISESDIEKLKTKKIITNDSIKKLQEEREKIIKDEEKDLFKQFNNSLNGEMSENVKLWQQIKRGFFIGLVFGMPGALFIAIKDNLDKCKVKNELKEAVKEYVENDNDEKIKNATDVIQKYFGKIFDVKGLMNNIKSSEAVLNLLINENEIKKTIHDYKEDKDKYEKETEKFIEEIFDEKEIQEIEEITDEEDPEPVEGMKFGI